MQELTTLEYKAEFLSILRYKEGFVYEIARVGGLMTCLDAKCGQKVRLTFEPDKYIVGYYNRDYAIDLAGQHRVKTIELEGTETGVRCKAVDEDGTQWGGPEITRLYLERFNTLYDFCPNSHASRYGFNINTKEYIPKWPEDE